MSSYLEMFVSCYDIYGNSAIHSIPVTNLVHSIHSVVSVCKGNEPTCALRGGHRPPCGARRASQPSAGARRRVAKGRPNLLVEQMLVIKYFWWHCAVDCAPVVHRLCTGNTYLSYCNKDHLRMDKLHVYL